MRISTLAFYGSAFGGRRFLLTLGCGAVCTGLVIFKVIDQYVYRDLIIATVVPYLAAGTYQKVKQNANPVLNDDQTAGGSASPSAIRDGVSRAEGGQI